MSPFLKKLDLTKVELIIKFESINKEPNYFSAFSQTKSIHYLNSTSSIEMPSY